jgi:hypothetical protein
MKLSAVICFFVSLLFCAEPAFAQTDTITYIRGLPQSGETSDKKDSIDHPPFNKRTNISVEQLPTSIVKTLESDKLYSGWQHGGIEFDKNTGFYHILIEEKKVIRKYVFNKDGTVISLDERNIPQGDE